MPVSCSHDARLTELSVWLNDSLALNVQQILPASADASFRRYFRVGLDGRSLIAMDAPPSHEDVRPFLQVAELMRAAGVHVPGVHAAQIEQGFLLLDDFGSSAYLDCLNADTVNQLYGDALAMLLRLQRGAAPATSALPAYDAALLHREMELFRDWFLQRTLGLSLSADEHAQLDTVWAYLIEQALQQPRVVVHRDYHSRNLMHVEHNNPGVLDFQDAVIGPITYDLVSLLRDCYIAWPRAQVETWATGYAAQLRAAGLLSANDAQFIQWFDLMGVQRHLKAIGIFARLNLRDGKPGYLQDIPRTFNYVVEVGARYPMLADWTDWLNRRVAPLLPNLSA